MVPGLAVTTWRDTSAKSVVLLAKQFSLVYAAVVVNRDGQLEQTVAQLAAIIDAEKCRVRKDSL